MRREIVMLAVMVSACGSPEADFEQRLAKMKADHIKVIAPLIDKQRPALTKQLAAFDAIGKQVKAAPPVTARVPLSPGAQVDIKTTAIGAASWFAGDPQQSPSYIENKDAQLPRPSFDLKMVRELVASGIWSDANVQSSGLADLATKALTDATSYKFALVLRAHTYKAATFDLDTKSFVGAHMTGDATLYSLHDSERLGAFPFEILQSGDIELKGDYANSRSGAEQTLAEHFRGGIDARLTEELEAFLKGAVGVATPGVAAEAQIDKVRGELKRDLEMWNLSSPAALGDVDISGTETITDVDIEPGPTIVLTTTKTSAFEKHRAELEKLIEKRVAGKPSVRFKE